MGIVGIEMDTEENAMNPSAPAIAWGSIRSSSQENASMRHSAQDW